MLGVGIIGAGHFGAAHAKVLQSVPNARLVAACRNDTQGLGAFIEAFGGAGYLDYRDLLSDPNVDAVVIALPHHLHTDVAIACAEAGKHIMIEKPMAPTVAECRDILAAAQRQASRSCLAIRCASPCLSWLQSGSRTKESLAICAMGQAA